MQILADVLDVPVTRPIVAETVSLGAAYTAGLAVGFWSDTDGPHEELAQGGRVAAEHGRGVRERGYRKWKKAVARAVDWVDDDE